MANNRKFITGGDMRTPVIFYTAKPKDDFLPGEVIESEYHQCFANVYPPSQKDLGMTDNEAKITLVTWYPIGKAITEDMYFEIQLPRYKGKKFNIKQIEDDIDCHRNLKVIGVYRQ